MSEKYSRSLLRISVAQICQNIGWNSAQNSALEVLTDVLEKYISKIGNTCHRFAEQYGRTEVNLLDLSLAFQHMGITTSELENYVHHVEPVPFAHEVVAFPAPKTTSLGFPNPRSREVLQHREEHIPDHMPYMFPNMKDEIPEVKTTSPLNGTVNGVDAPSKTELSQGNEEKDDSNVGDKRPAPISTPDLSASKRPRLGNLPEEAGHSQYEMTCVFMGPNGVLTTRQGCQGRLPEARMPPPNPRTLSEIANKENSGKTKDSIGGPKISINVGGIGTESLVSSKIDGKKSKKSPQKRKMLHEQAAKTYSKELGKELSKKSFSSKISVDSLGKELGKKLISKAVMEGVGKEIGKKSVSSKAAAKFLKKLKMNKKSSKHFSKSKIKDHKAPDVPHESGPPEKSKKLVVQTNSEEGKKKKEKKSAEFVDTDEELRNLSSPSSRVPSPERPLVIDTEGGAQMKARMEAISDSINSVLRDLPPKDGKTKKRKRKEEKTETSVSGSSAAKIPVDGKGQEVKVKRKPGRPPKIQKLSEPPPPVDVKPFVSDKYSSAELQVYEFNDSPPDASIPSRRPSAAETVAPSLPPPPPPPPQQPVVKQEPHVPVTKHATSSGSSSHKFHRRIQPEDDLFAPEFKIESRVDHSDHQSVKPGKVELAKEKEKPKVKIEKKEREEPPVKVPQKSKDVKGDRHKDRKDKHKDEKEREKNDDKEKHKEKEHRKDKKEKKKEKEKKKKHKERDQKRDKEKEKKPEEKVKQEARESRESSPAVGIGVKLKIKIGGGAGTPTSMMVTGESSAPASPAPSLGSKRESMSPPRVVPKIYISKKGQGTEEKSKKSSSKSSSQRGESSKRKPSSLAMSSSKSQSASQPASPSSSKTSPSPRSTPTPPVPRKTPTPPPNPKPAHKVHHSPHSKGNSSKQKEVTSLIPAKERPGRSPVKDRASKVEKKKKERKTSLSSLSSASSSSPSPPAKPSLNKRQTPPRLERMSTSPENSPPPLPFQSRSPSPRASSSAARSPSRPSSPHHSPTPPPSLFRRKLTPPPALSPREQSPSPTRPPTPGSTSPPLSPEWNLPVSSPFHPRSPTPTPRTPTASPSRNIPSPHASLPGSPIVFHRSPSPSTSPRPGSRLMDTPEPKPNPKDNPSPASSGKSSTSASKAARTVEAETVCVFYDDSGQKVWICPACKLPDDGSEMIGCDMCDNWYHWPCVGITEAPPEEQQWFCVKCLPKTKSSSRGRGRPRGRGRGRGRKKIT